MSRIRSITWVLAIVVGIGMLIAGPIMIYVGADARDQVRDELAAEKIVFTDDAEELTGYQPGELVDTAAEAEAFAEIVEHHYLESTGGKTYAEMDRDDPNRQTAFTADALRTSLYASVLAENVAVLVVGLGIAFSGIGLLMLFIGLALRPVRTAVSLPETKEPALT